MNRYSLITVCLLLSVTARAQTNITSDEDSNVVSLTTTVRGNQEHPSVTYIVPWQKAADKTVLNMPFKTRVGDIFNHIEREEHEREVEYLMKAGGGY